MRIAQVAPLFESVPPKLYGGTERVVSYLTEALVGMGHEVTLFASGDSTTSAHLVAPCRQALRLGRAKDPFALHILMIEEVLRRAEAGRFDVIHFHIDYLHFPACRRLGVPHVTTIHGRQDIPELGPLYTEFCDMPLVSISDSQRRPIPQARFEATVYHGLPAGLLTPNADPGPKSYLAFTGRMSPEKQPDVAIEIARRAGVPLKMAAKVDKADKVYFHSVVEPLLDEPGIEFIGEIDETQKREFLGNAIALLFPVNWPEPFGLVMIEAMACGTPTIAFKCGSVSEVLDQDVSGLVVTGVSEAVAAVRRAEEMDRAAVRARFESRFTSRRMAEDYLRVYRRLIGDPHAHQPRAAGALHGRHRPN